MVTKKTINLNQIERIKGFVQAVMMLDGVIDVGSGNYIVDGSSLLGVMSLDLSRPVVAVLHSDNQEVIDKFTEICERYE